MKELSHENWKIKTSSNSRYMIRNLLFQCLFVTTGFVFGLALFFFNFTRASALVTNYDTSLRHNHVFYNGQCFTIDADVSDIGAQYADFYFQDSTGFHNTALHEIVAAGHVHTSCITFSSLFPGDYERAVTYYEMDLYNSGVGFIASYALSDGGEQFVYYGGKNYFDENQGIPFRGYHDMLIVAMIFLFFFLLSVWPKIFRPITSLFYGK